MERRHSLCTTHSTPYLRTHLEPMERFCVEREEWTEWIQAMVAIDRQMLGQQQFRVLLNFSLRQ